MYGLSDDNATDAQQLYRDRFPGSRVPHVRVFSNAFRRIFETVIMKLRQITKGTILT